MRHARTRYRLPKIPPYILFRCAVFAVPMILILVIILCVRRCSAEPPRPMYTEQDWLEDTASLSIIEQYAVNNKCYQTNDTIRVRGLMLHSVGTPQPSAKIYADRFNTARPDNRDVCPHAFLQADGTVYQTLPWTHHGWHAGGSANNTHIGIELCEPAGLIYDDAVNCHVESTEDLEYIQNTYAAAVDLFAALCIRFQLDPLEDGVILSHAEGCARGIASDHSDPEHLWRGAGLPYTMDTFRSDVAARLTELQAE